LNLQRIVGEACAGDVAKRIGLIAAQGMVPDSLATCLELAADALDFRPPLENLLDLVTTGPEAGGVANRSTAVVKRAQAQWGEDERLHRHRQLSCPGAEKVGRETGAREAEFPGAAPHDCDARTNQGEREGGAGHPGTHEGRHHRQCLHAADRGGREADAGCDLRGVDGGEGGRSFINLVRFGTVGILGWPASDRI